MEENQNENNLSNLIPQGTDLYKVTQSVFGVKTKWQNM